MRDRPWVDSVTGPMTYVPTRTAVLTPSPELVADMVTRMIQSEWPTTERDRRVWFKSFGLQHERDVPRWDGDTEPGAVPTGWNTFKDEFVGVHWFLWEGWPRPAVEAAARELAALITTAWGQAKETAERLPIGSTHEWEVSGRVIDMYSYSGKPPAHLSRREMTPNVQLHVDHAERAKTQNQHARLESTEG